MCNPHQSPTTDTLTNLDRKWSGTNVAAISLFFGIIKLVSRAILYMLILILKTLWLLMYINPKKRDPNLHIKCILQTSCCEMYWNKKCWSSLWNKLNSAAVLNTWHLCQTKWSNKSLRGKRNWWVEKGPVLSVALQQKPLSRIHRDIILATHQIQHSIHHSI